MLPQNREGRGGGSRGGASRGGGYRGGDRGSSRGRGGFRGGGNNPMHSRGTGYRGRGRGEPPRYEAVEAPVFRPDPTPAVAAPGPEIAPGVTTIGVPRPPPGTRGQTFTVTSNNFTVTVPEATMYHYDVDIVAHKELGIKGNHALIRNLQTNVAPEVFTPRAGYDGRKTMYARRRLPLQEDGSQIFQVGTARVKLSYIKDISPSEIRRYQQGQRSIDEVVLSAFHGVNVILRMDAISRYPFNARSFFTSKEVRPVGYGIELWRGYFQSIRPGLRSMLVNVDISTGMMYASGPMIDICQQILRTSNINALAPDRGFDNQSRRKLERFLSGVCFLTSHKDKSGQVSQKPKVFRKISIQSADAYMFSGPDGEEISVARYFHSLGVHLQYPNLVCILTPKGAAFPIELCSIIPGQLMRKQVPPEVVKPVLEFSTKTPDRRLNSIVAGHQVLKYEDSVYMRDFGMTVNQAPEKCAARILPPPAIKYGPQDQPQQINPANGAWNVQNQKLFEPGDVAGSWAVINYDTRRVRGNEVEEIIKGLKAQADLLGIRGFNIDPPILSPAPQVMNVAKDLYSAGRQAFQKSGKPPMLLLVILPENSSDLHQAVKHFGDVTHGVATQCVLSIKALGSRPQYWSNVCLKINAKLGGVNSILDSNDPHLHFISDIAQPVMIIGADVMHPAPGVKDRPSFASLVGSIDSNVARYSGVSVPQDFRQEIIEDIENMVYELIGCHAWWKMNREGKKVCFPRRIVYYRDGVSEGQFKHVLDRELPAIQAACSRHNINPSITVVVVGKRHHVRFFPTHGMADRSGNCPSGTVVDDVVGHPIEFDFYLQSHAGILGTSRPAHYNVLYDENQFTADGLQALSFGLCHLYARSTRSVSIPAPVYYADLLCARAKNNYDPSFDYSTVDETETTISEGTTSVVERYMREFKNLHRNMRYKMFFQ